MRYEFCQFTTKQYRNFGIQVTSRTEGSHGVLKRLIKSRLIPLNNLLKAIEETLSRLQNNFEKKHFDETCGKDHRFSDPIFRRLRFFISFKALELITNQVNLARESIARNQSEVCSGAFRTQYGLPCKHTIKALLLVGGQLALGHIDKHWHLKTPVFCSL
jgi:hypothetical protein